MERLSIIASQRDGILESAATVCYGRAVRWQHEMGWSENRDLRSVYEARRNEADECKTAIRMLKHSPVSSNEKDIVKNVVTLLSVLRDHYPRTEYQQALQIFGSMYQMMGGSDHDWPLPTNSGTKSNE